MSSAPPPATGSRETRLLVVTLVVSAGMLLLLARFRFPERPVPAEVPVAPLERLASRATYDELAGILRSLNREIANSVVALHVVTGGVPGTPETARSFVPAVKVAADSAVALVAPGVRVEGVAGSPDAMARVVATDDPRGLALVSLNTSADVPALASATTDLRGPGYVAAVEATRNGPAVRPLYFGRVDPVQDPRWDDPLLRLSALQQTLPAGAAVFTLDARFIGLGRSDGRDVIIVPAGALQRAADRLSSGGTIVAAALDIEVQPLDSALNAATGTDGGVIVSHVAAGGAAAGRLMVGDVIRRAGGTAVRSMSDYSAAIVALKAGESMAIDVIRRRKPLTVSVTPAPRTGPAIETTDDLGLELRTVRGIGAEVVRVRPRSAAARAGVLPGDLITMAGDANGPDAARVTRVFGDLPAGQHVLIAIERGASHLVVALAKP